MLRPATAAPAALWIYGESAISTGFGPVLAKLASITRLLGPLGGIFGALPPTGLTAHIR